ncbi:MAG: CoA transferase [Pseudomonadota bacterium]|nr:CoA transferase [Pseudomonadota bacterium]
MAQDDFFNQLTIISLEQAIVVPYFTYKMVHEGARVIRIEHPIITDPNRQVGEPVLAEEGMNSYFLTINAGKQAVTLNLKEKRGQQLLRKLIVGLNVDIFVTNQLPKNYVKLGIDYETLSACKSDLIWIGVTGFGPESNEGAYDPILQARSGLMEMTGEPDGPPQVLGIPLPDMGSSEQVYALTMRALLKREVNGSGSRIDFSMFRSAVSWQAINLPMVASFNRHISRRGNTHEFFAPVSVFKTKDGFIYLAVGNDRQWQALTELDGFSILNQEKYRQNAGRIADVVNLNRQVETITITFTSEELLQKFQQITLPASKINTMKDLLDDPLIKDHLLKTVDPDSGYTVTLSPPAYDTPHLREMNYQLPFPPRLGEHNQQIYHEEVGIQKTEMESLKKSNVI